MVDSPQSLQFVRDCGVEYVQGFLFGKPNTNILSFNKMDKDTQKLFMKTGASAAYV
jgi:EAL domain-containing protein (putative c-di-GMP-specific phosphodiesterase class I)